MDKKFLPVVQACIENFNAQASEFRGDVTLMIPAEKIVDACRLLRDDFAFDMLPVETAVDYCPQTEPRFHVVYILYSTTTHTYLTLRAPVGGENPEIDTVESIFSNANWREREIWDLFGIRFKGHSDLRRIMMPPNWEGHPLRKDYPLGYEEVEFSFDYKDIDQRKPKGQR
jgi:NADH-quinone oxidoreductase subunit C